MKYEAYMIVNGDYGRFWEIITGNKQDAIEQCKSNQKVYLVEITTKCQIKK